MTLKALGFDIDGTLYPSLSLNLSLAGFAIRNYRYLMAFNAVRHELRNLIRTDDYKNSPPADSAEFHRLQASLVARRLGIGQEKVHDIIETLFYREIPENFRHVRPFKGAAEALKRLRDAGILLGALSDFPGDRKLELMGLDGLFHVSMTSEETGFLKPAPRSIEALSKRLGVSADEMLYVGNSVAYDVAGAKAAGARTALIRPLGGGASSGADFVFRRYDDLADWVLNKK